MLRFLLLCLILMPWLLCAQFSPDESSALRSALHGKINDLRVELGLTPLIFDEVLKKAAESQSIYMANRDKLTHSQTDLKNADPQKRVANAGGDDFEIVGENVLFVSISKFPLNSKEIAELAEQMFNTWRNSPGHFANMTEPEYVLADIAFSYNPRTQKIYATQVFGKKGVKIPGQLSKNSFGIVEVTEDCPKKYDLFDNWLITMGNSLETKNNEVVLNYHDVEYFEKIFTNENDGIAIDLVFPYQLACNFPNNLDFSEVYDGVLLKPIYRNELIANNRAQGDYRIITKVADIPEQFQGQEIHPSFILIKNGKVCKYVYPAYVPTNDYDLLPFEPVLEDETSVELETEGIIATQIIDYNFFTDRKKPIKTPIFSPISTKVHAVQIQAFSSVEGDSLHNSDLHNARAAFIRTHIESKLKIPNETIQLKAMENWDQMNFQLAYFGLEDLTKLSRDSLRKQIALRDLSLPWDSLFLSQRSSRAIISYSGKYDKTNNDMTLGEFNLRTAVAQENALLAKKALFVMHQQNDYNPDILFEPQIVEFCKTHPETVGNYAALLVSEIQFQPMLVSSFIYHWLLKESELGSTARTNLMHLYTHVSDYLIDEWDLPSARLAQVIHPKKIEKLFFTSMPNALILNINLAFISYYGQINDSPNISKSFYYIADYFKNRITSQEDDIRLALFFNYWSMYFLTIDHLLPRFNANKLNEEGTFILANTINHYSDDFDSEKYHDIHQNAIKLNRNRWCAWVNDEFQIKRDHRIKRIYCENCD